MKQANVRHATKLSNFLAQLCCATWSRYFHGQIVLRMQTSIEMVSIQQISWTTRQKLGNLRSQTGNFVGQRSWAKKLLNFAACLTLALGLQWQTGCSPTLPTSSNRNTIWRVVGGLRAIVVSFKFQYRLLALTTVCTTVQAVMCVSLQIYTKTERVAYST